MGTSVAPRERRRWRSRAAARGELEDIDDEAAMYMEAGRANRRKASLGELGTILRPWTVLYLMLVASLVGCGGGSESEQAPGGESEGYLTAGDGVRLFYRVLGSGRDTLVALHGGPGMDSEYLWPDFTPLYERHAVVFYDQRGGGRSDLPADTTALTIGDHVRDLETLRVHLGLEDLVLIAHSFGPALAAMYAVKYPERVARMIFLGAVPPRRGNFFDRYASAINSRLTEEEQRRLPELYEEMLSGSDAKGACREYWAIAMRPRMADPNRVSELRGDPCAASVEALRFGMGTTSGATWASLGDWDFTDRMTEVQAPTLIIHGEAETIPMDLVEEWTTVIPNGRLLRIPEAAHFPYVERSDVVWPAIEEFLTGAWPEGAMVLPGSDRDGGTAFRATDQTVEPIPEEVQSVCDSLTERLARYVGVAVENTVGDVVDQVANESALGCRLALEVDGLPDQEEGPINVLRSEVEGDWREDLRYAADGKDGTAYALRAGSILCIVRAEWEGGDELKSMPVDSYAMQIECMPTRNR